MSPNVEELRRVQRHVRRYPEKHGQGSWASQNECGTTACVAGRAVILHGGKPLYESDGLAMQAEMPDGRVVEIEAEAARILGLDEFQALDLFYSFKGYELHCIIDSLCEGTWTLDP